MDSARKSRVLRAIPLSRCLSVLLLAGSLVFLGGCLEFKSIGQPASIRTGDIFTVYAEVRADVEVAADDEGENFLPYFGMRLPSGWTIGQDSLVCTGIYSGTIVYDRHLTLEQESIDPASEGYYWWVGAGGPGTGKGSVFSDIRIQTDNQTGLFSVDYMLGDSRNGLNQQRSNGHLVQVIADVPAPTELWAVVEDESVYLSWSIPQPSQGLIGYVVYRDGEVLNTTFGVDAFYLDDDHAFYIDDSPGAGIHTYTVASLYNEGNVYFALDTVEVFVCAGGTGEPDDPFRIATAGQLTAIGSSSSVMDKYFVLISDIDLDPNLPGGQIFDRAMVAPDTSDRDEGFQGSAFAGTFNGSGHTVSHLAIEGNSYLGLFGALGPEAHVINVHVVDVDVTGNGWDIGALAGIHSGTVKACYSSGLVMGYSDVGGLVGSNDHGQIIDSHSSTDVVGIEYVGGVIGSQLATHAEGATVLNSFATGDVFAWQWVGGIVGFNQGTVSKCSSSSFINGSSCLGGLVGYNDITGSLGNCFSCGTVRGDDTLGGLVGGNMGSIRFTYSTAEVVGVSHIGGLVGKAYTQAEVVASFWDVDISGQSTSEGGIGVTTTELQDVNTYVEAGWDFAGESDNGTENVWYISMDSYARFFSFQGTGTRHDPYQIDSVWHLLSLGSDPEMLDKHFKLTSDIDLDPNLLGNRVFTHAVIAPDGDPSNDSYEGVPFSGTFDGCGHEIRNMRIIGSSYLGLFGLIGSEAHVSNLSVLESYVECLDRRPGQGGVLTGTNEGQIEACHTSGSVSGRGEYVGGLIGYNLGTVTYCTSSADVQGWYHVGGLVGDHRKGHVVDCQSTGTVQGLSAVSNAGGLIGRNSAYVGRCYSNGSATGGNDVGGLVGGATNGSIIEQCYSTGPAAGHDGVGGLVGSNGGTINECYSIGIVTGDDNVGGLVGGNSWSVKHSFWNIGTSGQSTSAGGLGLSTAQMQDINTYLNAGWDFFARDFDGVEDTWVMETYPVLFMSQLLGNGSSGSPYLISNKNKVIVFKNMLPTAHYRLTEDIDLHGIQWEGSLLHEYFGVFDGAGYSLRNLTITGKDYLGLFGRLRRDAAIKNLTIENVTVEGSGKRIGGLVGRNYGLVSNCRCTGVVTGDEYVGGLVGRNEGHVSNCSSSATVTGGSEIGGVVGINVWSNAGRNGEVIGCYSEVTVSGDTYVGGVVGLNESDVTNCYSIATVSGVRDVGCLVGQSSGTIGGCFSGGKASGSSESGSQCVGGLVGRNCQRITTIYNIDKDGPHEKIYNPGLISRCHSTAQVRGDRSIGGLVGWNRGSTITTSYSTGLVSGDIRVGGLVGQSNGSVTSCYSTGGVTGNDDAGGLVGYNYDGGSITTSYSNGAVSGDTDLGGLVGSNHGSDVYGNAVITASFWDVQTSGRIQLCGIQEEGATGCDDSLGLTTAEMQTLNTFLEAGWNIKDSTAVGTNDIWCIHDGQDYPALGWEFRPRCVSFPSPQQGTVNIHQPLVLGWQVGTWTAHHDVYFSDNEQRVALATTEELDVYQGRLPAEVNTYDPGALRYNTTYFWRIDEVTEAGLDASCYVSVWHFNTADFIASHSPASRMTDIGWPAFLSWVPSGQALWYDVYFGENENTVARATPESVGLYRGRQTANETAFYTDNLQPHKTYFWRIDGVDNTDAQKVWKGEVRQFTAARPIVQHTPGHYATDIPRSVILRWEPGGPGLQYHLYVGTDEDAVADATPDSVGIYRGQQTSDETTLDPGSLESSTTYFWRIDAVDSTDPQHIWKGDVWRFATGRMRSR